LLTLFLFINCLFAFFEPAAGTTIELSLRRTLHRLVILFSIMQSALLNNCCKTSNCIVIMKIVLFAYLLNRGQNA